MLKKAVKAVALPIALSALLVGCSNDDVIATVEDKEITESELVKELKEMYGAEVLDSLIANKIVDLEAEVLKIAVTEKEINAEFDSYAEAYGGKEALLEAVGHYEMTEDDVREDIRSYLLTVKVMENYIALTDEEVQAYFEQNQELYSVPAKAEVSQIIVETKQLADELIAKIKAGEDFATLAKAHSLHDETAEQGGAMGMITSGQMAPALDDAIFNANVGQVVGPIETEDGFYIVKITDLQAAQEANFDELKETVREELLHARVDEEYSSWLDGKYEEYEIMSNLFQ